MSHHNKDQQQQREVAIFWDYENVRLPRFCGSAAVAAKAIGKTVATYGRIVDRRLYYDFSKNNCGKYLDSSGFDLVNTPSRHQKETLDKKLIADVLTFAWDSTLRNHTKPCVVLITGDGDYAYTLSKLRDRGIMTVVMTGENRSVASILVETADCALSLEHDVLFPKDTTTSVNNNNALTLTAAPTTPTTPLPCNPINPVDMDFVRVICRILRSTVSSHVDGWVNMAQIVLLVQRAVHMSTHNHDDVKQRARTIRDQAVAMGVMELGRRRCGTKSTIVSITNRPPNKKMDGSLSNEVYGRLLPRGEQLLLDAPPHELSKNHPVAIDKAKSNKNNTTWFLKYVPPSVSLSELVAHMETTLQVEVRHARVETNPFGKRSAHVELTRSTSMPNYISYQTHAIQVYPNTQRNPFPRFWSSQSIGSNPSYYESKQHPRILQENQDGCLLFCRAMVDAGAGPQHWINAGLVGTSFRQLLALDFLHHQVSKEDMRQRFRNARGDAMEKCFVEMARKRRDSSGAFVPIAFWGPKAVQEPFLSSEIYYRLTQDGLDFVSEGSNDSKDDNASIVSSTSISDPTTAKNKFVYISNLPLSTTATTLVEFLEANECPPRHIELELETCIKGNNVLSAHVECPNGEQAARIMDRSMQGGVVFCGKSIYMKIDRSTPSKVVLEATTPRKPEWSYVRDDTSTDISSMESTRSDCLSKQDSSQVKLTNTEPPPPSYDVALALCPEFSGID